MGFRREAPRKPVETYLHAEELLLRARSTRQAADYRRAVGAYGQAAQLASGPRFLFQIGRAHAAAYLGDPQTSRAVEATLREHWPENPRAMFWAGYAWKRSDPDRSLEGIGAAAALPEPGGFVLHAYIDELLDRDDPRALPLARKNAAAHPEMAMPHEYLGRALDAAGQGEAAIASFRTAASITGEGELSMLARGRVLRRLGRHAEAAKAFRIATGLPDRQMQAWVGLGNTLYEAEDYEGARAVWTRAVEVLPHSGVLRNGLGLALARLNDEAGAEAQFRKAVELDPTYPEAHLHLGLRQQRRGDLDGAIASFRSALEHRPDYGKALMQLGGALLQRNAPEEALHYLIQATEADPAPAGCWYNRAVAHQLLRQLPEAEHAFRRALEEQPDLGIALAGHGTVLVGLNRRDEAIERYLEAAPLLPRNSLVHDNLFALLHQAGRWQEATLELARWAELASENEDEWLLLAHYLEEQITAEHDANAWAAARSTNGGDAAHLIAAAAEMARRDTDAARASLAALSTSRSGPRAAAAHLRGRLAPE